MINSILQCVIGINLRFGNGDNIPLTIFQGRDPRIGRSDPIGSSDRGPLLRRLRVHYLNFYS